MYDHFQKTQQLARGEGKIEFSVDICCIGTSGKTAHSAHPKVDLLAHRNVWKRGVAPGKNVPQLKRTCIPCILLLYVKRNIVVFRLTVCEYMAAGIVAVSVIYFATASPL